MSLDLWIEVRVRLRRDPKLRRFCRTLNIQRTLGLGTIVDLWLYAAEQGSEDGDMTTTDRRDLALELDFTEDKADELWNALTEVGPISRDHPQGEPGFVTTEGKIHKWEDFRVFFNLALLKKDKALQRNKLRVRKHRESQRKSIPACNASGNGSVMACTPHTGPDLTGQTSKHPMPPEGDEIGMTPEDLMNLWNEKADKILPRVKGLSTKRIAQAKARIQKNPSKEYWTEVIAKMSASDFCRGITDRGDWRASFDFMLQPDTGLKVLEGRYDNRKGGGPAAKGAGAAAPDEESTASRMEQA